MNKKFEAIILKRYSERKFSKLYYGHSKSGLKDYESILVKRFLNIAKDVLVIGCGCGREVIPLAKKGFNVVAVDIAEEMVRQAKHLCKEFKVKANIFQMNATNHKFKSNSFDAVLLFNCVIDQILGHKNRKKIASEARRTLRPDGVCIAVSNNALYPRKDFCHWIEHAKEILPYLKHKTKREFLDRVYKDNNQEVYVHLSTPSYLKNLFKKQFDIVLSISTEGLIEGRKRFVDYFAPNLVIVLAKGG